MGHDHHRGAEAAVDPFEESNHVPAGLRVELARGLVGEQQARRRADGRGQCHQLLGPSGEIGHRSVHCAPQTQPAQQFLGRPQLAPPPGAGSLLREPDVLGGGGIGEKVGSGVLQHVADFEGAEGLEFPGRSVGKVHVADQDLTGRWTHHSRQQTENGGLTHTRGTEQGDHLAGFDIEVHTS